MTYFKELEDLEKKYIDDINIRSAIINIRKRIYAESLMPSHHRIEALRKYKKKPAKKKAPAQEAPPMQMQ